MPHALLLTLYHFANIFFFNRQLFQPNHKKYSIVEMYQMSSGVAPRHASLYFDYDQFSWNEVCDSNDKRILIIPNRF